MLRSQLIHLPYSDHYHGLLRNIHHRAECACLGLALKMAKILMESTNAQQLEEIQVVKIVLGLLDASEF